MHPPVFSAPTCIRNFSAGVLALGWALPARAQTRPKMDFETYNPVSTLVVPAHPLERAKFPFIDVHNHQRDLRSQDLGTLTRQMDSLNLSVMVNLSGRGGDFLAQSACWKPRTNIFPTTKSITPFGACMAWGCRTRS